MKEVTCKNCGIAFVTATNSKRRNCPTCRLKKRKLSPCLTDGESECTSKDPNYLRLREEYLVRYMDVKNGGKRLVSKWMKRHKIKGDLDEWLRASRES